MKGQVVINVPKMKTELSEADLHIITWALSGLTKERIDETVETGILYGVPQEGHPIMDLFERLSREWDQWVKTSKS